MIDVHALMKALSDERPVFHSEADFQHAFAWLIQQRFPDAKIRLELPFEREDRSGYLDVWVSISNRNWAFELKYKTSKTAVHLGAEQFNLKNHGAQDLGRYDVLKDVERLEHLVSNRANTIGYSIFITNDSSYWNTKVFLDSIDKDFLLHNKRELQGILSWGLKAAAGTTKGRTNSISLKNLYIAEWFKYSHIPIIKNGEFYYSVFQVNEITRNIV